MKLLRRNLLLCSVLIGISAIATAQNTKNFPTVISGNTTLDSGVYSVKGNNIVREGANLIINSGTKLEFAENAYVQVKGGLVIAGSKNDFVTITSADSSAPGMGFEILRESDLPIRVDYADFSYMKKPIKLSKYWLRPVVDITNSQFHDLNDDVFMEILEIDKILLKQDVDVTITGNTFGNNASGMMISDAAWKQLHINISNNVFSRNQFIGRDYNGIFTTPLFLNYNEQDEQLKQPDLKGNSISYNYIGFIGIDTVEYSPVYLTVVGSADKMNISDNYYGIAASEYLTKAEENINASQRAPYLEFSSLQETPSSDLNGHVYEIMVNGVSVDHPNYDLKIDRFTDVIQLVSNKPVLPTPNYTVSYVYLDEDTLRRYAVNQVTTFEQNNRLTKITLDEKIIKKHEYGFIEVGGLIDQNGFDVPRVSIGLKQFLNENREFFVMTQDYQKIPRVDMTDRIYVLKDDDMDFDPDDTSKIITDSEILQNQKYWDVSFLTSSTVYFGDLVSNSISLFLPNVRPHVGVRLGYHFNPNFKFELSHNTLMLAGADNRETKLGQIRGTNYQRDLSFRTMVYDLGVNLAYYPFQFTKLTDIRPSVHAGITGYHFNPQAEYEGTWYNLRPIGTEGQTIDPNKEPYSKFHYAIPLGLRLEKHFSQRFVLGINWTYNKLFTDYLDDVSTGYFPDPEALKAANLELGEVAVELSNPSRLTGQRSTSADRDGFAYFGFIATLKL